MKTDSGKPFDLEGPGGSAGGDPGSGYLPQPVTQAAEKVQECIDKDGDRPTFFRLVVALLATISEAQPCSCEEISRLAEPVREWCAEDAYSTLSLLPHLHKLLAAVPQQAHPEQKP